MANTLSSTVPQIWSQETLAILEEEMTIARRVNRQFSSQVQSQGDVVNISRPSQFTAVKKNVNDSVTIQDATTTNVAVTLNQVAHTSFAIKDLEAALSNQNLISLFLRPAAISLARQLDTTLLVQNYQFRQTRDPGSDNQAVGQLGSLAASNVKSTMIAARKQLRKNRGPDGWDMYVSPETEAIMLELDLFNAADKIGDDGTQLRNASLGKLLGFNVLAPQNVPFVETAAQTTNAGDTDGVHLKGSTTLDVQAGSGTDYAVGQFITIESDLSPYQITAISTDELTLDVPLRFDSADTEDVNRVTTAAVDLVAGYAAGWDKAIAFDGSGVPVVGQMVCFGADTTKYGVVSVSGSTITLDRPLVNAIVDNAVIGLAPAGGYDFPMHPDCMTLVNRPLGPVMPGAGGVSGVASFNDLSMRTVIAYRPVEQDHLVTMDILYGLQVLDKNYATIMYS